MAALDGKKNVVVHDFDGRCLEEIAKLPGSELMRVSGSVAGSLKPPIPWKKLDTNAV